MESYNLFNFQALYAFIVEFFDSSSGPEAQKQSQSLFKWWTMYVFSHSVLSSMLIHILIRQIFPHQMNVSNHTCKSRDKLTRQRAMQETTPPI